MIGTKAMTKPHAQAKSGSARTAQSASQKDILPLEQMMAHDETNVQAQALIKQGDNENGKNQALVPALRFTGFSDGWAHYHLREAVVSFDYGLNAPAKPYDFKNKYLRIKDIDEISRTFSTADLTSPDTDLVDSDKYLAREGDLFFARTGSIGRTYLYSKDEGKVLFAGYLIRGHIKQDLFSPDFVFYNTLTNGYYSFVKTTSARSVQPGINAQEYGSYKLAIPSLPEQQRIGALFKELDRNLSLNRAQLGKLTQLKTSMLEQMFPQEGEDVPRLRFDGFTEPWQPTLLKDAVTSLDYGLNAPSKPFDFSRKFIHIQDIEADSRELATSGLTSPDVDNTISSHYTARYGDIFFARSGATVGRTYRYLSSDGCVIFACHLIRGQVKNNYFCPNFVFYTTLTKSFNYFVKITSLRSAIPGVNAQEYGSYQFKAPSLAEQERIGAFFKALDERLALQRAKIEKLEQLKKALLEQMFV